jgi:hypothetical protein
MADATTAADKPAPTAWPRFIELFILYPALGTSLLAAVPTVWNEYKAFRLGIRSSELQIAEQQTRLWSRNAECLQQGSSYEVDGPHNIVVRVTLCQSTGDTLLRYHVGAWEPIYRWVSLPVEKVKR